jgi:two-component system, chemotaxis family, protein-glutamate methylesterase/glutaminase
VTVAPDIVVLGASAGGVDALMRVVSGLGKDFPAALFAVLHVGRTQSLLPEILARATDLPVAHAVDGEAIRPGRLRVAPPDRHLVLERGRIRLTQGPEENGSRPAIDPLFRSAARAFGPRVIGVILTGALDDGVTGLVHIKQAGGRVVVQSPRTAAVPSMPLAALDAVVPDVIASLDDISGVLDRLVRTDAGLLAPAQEGTVSETEESRDQEVGVRSALTCPSCHGALWEVDRHGVLQFRCRVGHAYSTQSMIDEQAAAVDRALWAGLRALEERGALNDRLATGADARGHARAAKQFRGLARRARLHADRLRGLMTDPVYSAAPDDAPPGTVYEEAGAESSDASS